MHATYAAIVPVSQFLNTQKRQSHKGNIFFGFMVLLKIPVFSKYLDKFDKKFAGCLFLPDTII